MSKYYFIKEKKEKGKILFSDSDKRKVQEQFRIMKNEKRLDVIFGYSEEVVIEGIEESVELIDYTKKTVKQLKEILDGNVIEYPKSAKKQDLINLILGV